MFPHEYVYGDPMGLSFIGMIMNDIFWLIVIGLVIWAVFHWGNTWGHTQIPGSRPSVSAAPAVSATEILRQRYARGEIDLATFDQMLDKLHDSEAGDKS